MQLTEYEYDDGPKIETTLIVESSLMKECFIFINFFCANLLFVFLILYPIKRLTKGVTVIEQLPTYKFKFVLFVFLKNF